MTTRNLTKKFEQLRAQQKQRREAGIGRSFGYEAGGRTALLPGDTESDARSPVSSGLEHALPPQWVEIVTTIEADIKLSKDNFHQLQQLHAERLKVRFRGDEKEKEKEIDILTSEITRLLKKSENNLKRIALIGNSSGTLPKEERTVRLNVMRNYANQIQALSKEFRHSQKEFYDRLKGQEEIGSEFFQDGGSSSMTLDEALERGLTEDQVVRLQEMESKASERAKEILHIAQSINDLAQIFKELNVLVVEQGTVLDRIDYQVEQSLVKVRGGLGELKAADKISRKARTLKCIAALILINIILIIILVAIKKK